MKQLEHQQKLEMEKAEHLLRLQLLGYQLAYYRGMTVESSNNNSNSNNSPVARGQSPASV